MSKVVSTTITLNTILGKTLIKGVVKTNANVGLLKSKIMLYFFSSNNSLADWS